MAEANNPAVFLHGSNDRAGMVARFCRAGGIRVKGMVYSNGETHNPYGLPGVDVNDLTKRPEDARIPIVICSNPAINMEDGFITALVALKSYFGVPNPVLHPSFLSEFMRPGERRRLLLNGFPGSGNMIFQALVYDLTPSGLGGSPDKLEQQFIQLNSEYFWSMRNLIERCIDIHNRKASHLYPVLRDQIGIMMTIASQESPDVAYDVKRQVVFSGLPARSSSWTDIQGSHEAYG